MQTTKFVKQPVAVSVIVEKDGRVFPRKFLWKDGHTYKIDRITRVERAASGRNSFSEHKSRNCRLRLRRIWKNACQEK